MTNIMILHCILQPRKPKGQKPINEKPKYRIVKLSTENFIVERRTIFGWKPLKTKITRTNNFTSAAKAEAYINKLKQQENPKVVKYV